MQMDQKQQSTKPVVFLLILLGILLGAVLLTRPILFGETKPYQLQKSDPLVGRISQALTPNNGGNPPTPGRDFTLLSTTYFENGTWVVTNIKTLDDSSGGGMVVLKETDGIFDIVLGPGTAFDSYSVDQLPSSVSLYIKNNGVVYDPVF